MIDLRHSAYFRINAEVWQFFKSSLPVQDNDHYWSKVLTAGEEVVKRYENTAQAEFAKEQTFAVINELERIKKAGSFDSLRPGTGKDQDLPILAHDKKGNQRQ